MKAFSTKIILLCGVFLTSFTCLSAQTGFLCDTVILKSGGLMFVKIVDTRSDIIAYRECTMDNNLTLYSLDLDKIREIRKAYVEQYVYNLKPKIASPYLDFGVGGGISSLGLDVSDYLSIGYQFNPKFGLGISAIGNLHLNYSSAIFYSYSVDYRYLLNKAALYGHLGFVSPRSKIGDEYCRIKLIDSKVHPFLAFSWRHFNKRHFSTGITASFTYANVSETCVSPYPPTSSYGVSVLAVTANMGFYFPTRYKKELVR